MNERDPRQRPRIEIEVEPTVTGRFARWLAGARVLRGRVENARSRHPSLDLVFHIFESDSSIGGGLLAGATLLLTIGAAQVVGWIRRHDELGGVTALLVYVTFVGGAWL